LGEGKKSDLIGGEKKGRVIKGKSKKSGALVKATFAQPNRSEIWSRVGGVSRTEKRGETTEEKRKEEFDSRKEKYKDDKKEKDAGTLLRISFHQRGESQWKGSEVF